MKSDTPVQEEKPAKKEKMIELTFKENRKFELYIGRNMTEFLGAESKQFPESILNHPDFKSVEKYFIVKEVK